MILKSRPIPPDESNIVHRNPTRQGVPGKHGRRSSPTRPSREAATDCSPQRKLWVSRKKSASPKGRRTTRGRPKPPTPMTSPTPTERDPVCGMNVNPATAKHVHQHAGKNFYFCCAGCVEKFKANPQIYLNKPAPSGLVMLGMPLRAAPPPKAALESLQPETGSPVSYVCPMCPEVRESKPGACPSCGMALEPDVPMAASRHRIHLPDASPNRALRARIVPHLRDGARAAHGHRGARRKSRTARHDAPLLGRRRAHRAAAHRSRWAACSGVMLVDSDLAPLGLTGVHLNLPRLRILFSPLPSSSGAACRSSSASGHRSSTAAPTCSR